MADQQNDRNRQAPDENSSSAPSRSFNVTGDLTHSPRDQERITPETVIMDLPEVKDIPGQEHVSDPLPGMLADTTISSDDEEGVGILDEDLKNPELLMNNDSDLADEEKNLLENADTTMPTDIEKRLTASSTDNKDFEGEELEEKSFSDDVTGINLEPGSNSDNRNESLGEEDEENNLYSLGGDFEEGGEG
jgi:hypothetical protein